MEWQFTYIFVSVTLISENYLAVGQENNERLFLKLFNNYYRDLGPTQYDSVTNESMPLIVMIKPQLYSIIDVREADETVTITQWFNMYWNDSRLKWNPSDYNGIESLTVLDSRIWMPDVKMYEMLHVMRSEILPYYARLKHTGEITVANSLVTRIHCQLDVKDFPYDTQNCSMIYACWTHTSKEIILKSRTGNVADSGNFKKGAEWDLQSYKAREVAQQYSSGLFYEVHFYFVLVRKPGYYILTLTFPSFLIVTIAILGLFSPFQATQERQEKVTLGLTALLTIAVILMMVAELMPKSSIDFPLLGDYILYEMILISCATIVAVCIMYLHSQAKFGHAVPSFLYRILFLNKLRRETNTKGTDWTSRVGTAQTPISVHSKKDEKIQVLYNILATLKHYRAKIEDNDEDDQLNRHWMLICFRLDLIFLTIFMIVQMILSAFYVRMFD